MGRVGSLIVLVLGLVAAGPVRADSGERLVITSLTFSGKEISDEAKAQYARSLFGGLSAAGFQVIPDDEVVRKLEKRPGLYGCETPICRRGLGEALGARWTLHAELALVGNSHSLRLELSSTTDGKVVAEGRDDCPVCTVKETNDALSLAAAALHAKAVAIEAPAQVQAQQQQQVIVAQKPTGRQWALRGAGLGAFAVGAGALIAGFVELGRDHSRACTPLSGSVDCSQRNDTTGGQALGFALAGAVVVTGAVLTYFGWRHPRAQVSVAPTATGARLQLRVSF